VSKINKTENVQMFCLKFINTSSRRHKNINIFIKRWETTRREEERIMEQMNLQFLCNSEKRKTLPKVDESGNSVQAYYLDIWGAVKELKNRNS
jgi:hypothetical protein